jgi:hypothetical protein
MVSMTLFVMETHSAMACCLIFGTHVSGGWCSTLETLPIGVQELNNTSLCGFLAYNSLEHFAFPESFPLLACSGIQAVRMSCFILAS